MNEASLGMREYFDSLNKEIGSALKVASTAREKNFDPQARVELHLAKNMAERVEGLIAVLAPQIKGSGVVERIMELEKLYGILDWRVALKISEEVSKEMFCSFKNKIEAIDVGIRTGFAYATVGVVSSPLDGIVEIFAKKRNDGKEFLCVKYAGPIRNAGGTAASVSVLIADYVRQKHGFEKYDVRPEEVKRAITELRDYHERVTNLQFYPSDDELDFLMNNLPVEVSGDPSEKIEVSNYKDLERVDTNFIRSGFCLMLSSCLSLKAPKLWKQLGEWGVSFGLDNWNFLEKFIEIQKKLKAKKSVFKKDKISPDFTYISDLAAGRPVLGYPLRPGGFRLRYGRSRISGYSCQSIHPATMVILNGYIASGTQLKTERPGKATVVTPCDSIEGPIVRLVDGCVLRLDSFDQAKKYDKQIEKILFLGDILCSYGDFFNRAHSLVPVGFCEEWWAQEVIKSVNFDSCSVVKKFVKRPFERPTAQQALQIAKETGTFLHPAHTYHWKQLNQDELIGLLNWLKQGRVFKKDGAIEKIVLNKSDKKAFFDKVGLPHKYVNNEFAVVEGDEAEILNALFCFENIDEVIKKLEQGQGDAVDLINSVGRVKIRDKSGTFIGARMGRPEKAKQRKLKGDPHVLFPVGEEGGRLKSFQSALDVGKITAEFSCFYCDVCKRSTISRICENCKNMSRQVWVCQKCGLQENRFCDKHGENKSFEKKSVLIRDFFEKTLNLLGTRNYPELVKGVRGISNKDRVPESLAKGILRAKYGIHVYKDGTTRFDMIQLPMTHFKPVEIGTDLQKLKELGYDKDVYGEALKELTQIVELKPQDIILPSGTDGPDPAADDVLIRISQFVDDLLVDFYKQKKYYCIKNTGDLLGQLTIVLAPHTSAGTIGRIIGFSQSRGLFAHPLLHAATRRDCDGDEACVILLMDAFLNFSRSYLPETRGSTMDTPLVLTSILIPSEVDDMVFDLDIVDEYPLELYYSALEYNFPWDVKVGQLKSCLHKPEQYEGLRFTHDTSNLNKTVKCSAYKLLPSMEEKIAGQMEIAEKLSSVNAGDVAKLIVEKHLLKDTKGNLRKFSTQEFRCVKCNKKFRRTPLVGKCIFCGGRLIFTVAEGSVIKYLKHTTDLAEKYIEDDYLKQSIELLKMRIDDVFGKEKEKQLGLTDWV